MKKRILAFLLCVCLVLPLFVGAVTANERTTTAYDGNISKKATFNPYYFEYGGYPISAAPENEPAWSAAQQLAGSAALADVVLVITDVRVVQRGEGVPSEYWYQVAAAEGCELPAELAEKSWIFQNIEGESPDYDSLIIDQSSDPEETDPEETDPGESDPGESDPEETEPEWLSYFDYITAQMEKTFADPSLYVGYEAVFDVALWSNFRYAADPAAVIPGEEENLIPAVDLTDSEGNSLRIRIVGSVTDAQGQVWYQVEAAEGCTLPDILVENPYILHIKDMNDSPSLVILPQQGMFLGETVDVLKEPVAATPFVTLATADLPAFFDVIPADADGFWYDLGDIAGWHTTLAEKGYHYVAAENVLLIAPEVTVAYEKLKNADSAEEYNAIWETLPESVRDQFSDKHLSVLDQCHEALNNVQYSETVEYNGKSLNVSVSGPIPKSGVSLHVSPVSNETVLSEGFDIENATEIITALDIKILREDNTEWQPADGEHLQLSIDMAVLGIPDGKVVRLHHKHDGRIYKRDVFIVMDGKLTVVTTGFSIYVVDNVGDDSGTEIWNGGTASVTIGETAYFYYRTNNNNGTWIVNDPSGAIHYTVHNNSDNSAGIGHNQVKARWIKIVGLKETTTPIKLTYSTGNSQETYDLNVTVPRAKAGEKKLYLKDDVNLTGRLVAALVDENGNEIKDGLVGAAFKWTRNDGLFIVPAAYDKDYSAVNIARDHGGLVEARKTAAGYTPVIYTLDVILSDGTELSADYTVYYQSEIINAGFEFPDSKYRDYSFFPNGYPELYWKTTAPGTGTGNITKDIEYGDVTDQTNANQGETSYGVWRAADWEEGGSQFAELNAEEIGALYQDIITAPHEDIEWEFAHAKRPDQPSWAPNVRNKMYLVIGATEKAQALTNAQLNTLVREARNAAGSDADFMNCRKPYKLTFSVDGAQYWVWYHDADDQTDYSAAGKYGWETLEGSYSVPDNQYRTRIFFVSDPDSNTNNKNAGNVIDTSSAGQYKHYLVEYYEQTYTDGHLVTNRIDAKQEQGKALVYSSVILQNYDYFIGTEHDYLYKILINGENYPYDIRYSGKPSLYVEKYEGTATDPLEQGKTYEGIDIVMQVFLRDTVVAVQKELKFPTTLTEEQKLKIMEDLNKEDGYVATFEMTSPDTDYTYYQKGNAVVTSRDPMGNYKGFIALGDNPVLGHKYQIEETELTKIPGLELEKVIFGVTRYSHGVQYGELVEATYTEIHFQGNERLLCEAFTLEGDIKIADVNVVNQYKEKMTTIYYKAVGTGKVALTGQTNFQDIPMEELAFYSGKSIGAEIHTGNGASFAGWFKDEACTIPVEPSDGVVGSDGSFRPNANIINADEVTFYAKFTTGTIVINRTGAEPGQSFVYHVEGKTTDNKPVILDLTLTCGADGSGSTQILEVLNGTYTITEIPDWSWRFQDGGSQTVTHNGSERVVDTVTFTGDIQKPGWLSGLSKIVKNIFKGASS